MQQTNDGPDHQAAETLALGAMAWIVGDADRAERFLALTGTTPDALRAGATDPRFLAQLILHLEAHEPDLVACADAIGADPAALVAARRRLERA